MLPNVLLRKLRSRVSQALRDDVKISYSQCGEDLIVRYVFDMLNIANPTYLDIGAHDPTYLSNTKLFYDAGSRGVNVEPDPSLFAAFVAKRPLDVNLNVGVADRAGVLPFVVMIPPTLNTFSRESADAAVEEGNGGVSIEKVVDIQVRTIDDIIARHLPGGPDFLSVDVEGLDLEILKSLNYARHRPKVICVETLTFACGTKGAKVPEIGAWLESQGYFLYADTYLNTIFVDRRVWQ